MSRSRRDVPQPGAPGITTGGAADAFALRGSTGAFTNANPYSLDADGWCEPSEARARAYSRRGPPIDPRTRDQSDKTLLARRLDTLRREPAPALATSALLHRWMTHPRRDFWAPLFPHAPAGTLGTALRRFAGAVRVRTARGDVVALEQLVNTCQVLTPLERTRILDVLVDLRHAWSTRATDRGYDEINWRHACQEVGQILDEANAVGMSARMTEDAVLASLFSDAAKLRSNFLTHHIDGAVAAAVVLPRHLDVSASDGAERLVVICQAILEHQVGPPRFMAQMVRMGIEQRLRDENVAIAAHAAALDRVHAKIADPMNPLYARLHPDGYGVLALASDEATLLSKVGLEAWYIPHPSTEWFTASTAVIDADSLVNYVTPDGVGKIVAICGPGTPFRDPTVFHSIFSCGASFVDAVSVMSDQAMSALREGVRHTRVTIDAVRARILEQLNTGALRFSPAEFKNIVEQEQINVSRLTLRKDRSAIAVELPHKDTNALPYWSTPLDYDAHDGAYEFAKLIRRRVADLLREA